MTSPADGPTNLPIVRTDLVDVYVFRRSAGRIELLQLRRSDGDPADSLHGTWQPVMGHLEGHESAPDAAARELKEETGLTADKFGSDRFFALEQIHPFYLPSRNAIMLTPRFACEASEGWEPTLNHEHDASRWVGIENADKHFMWPGQRACIAELRQTLESRNTNEP